MINQIVRCFDQKFERYNRMIEDETERVAVLEDQIKELRERIAEMRKPREEYRDEINDEWSNYKLHEIEESIFVHEEKTGFWVIDTIQTVSGRWDNAPASNSIVDTDRLALSVTFRPTNKDGTINYSRKAIRCKVKFADPQAIPFRQHEGPQ